MNNPFVHEQAKKLAARLLESKTNDGARIEQAFLLVYGRPAGDDEKSKAVEYLGRAREKLATHPREQQQARAWESLARALFMSNEFVYLE
jgi:hypothetical protein